MNQREKLEAYLQEHTIEYKYFEYQESVHTVADAVRVGGMEAEEIAKSVIFRGPNNETIRAVVLAHNRASTKRICKALNIEAVTMMTPEEALEATGYPVGGMPCVGYEATTIIDPTVLEKQKIYTSGGTDRSLLLITVEDVRTVTNPVIERIRK